MALVLDVDHVSQLHDLFEMHIEQGLHHEAQLLVFKDGTEVVNAASGTVGPSGGRTDPRENLAMASVTNGIRDEAENRRRMNVVADAVRTAFDAT